MSRPIAESVSLLSETLTNCKTNLKDKGVESDTIKISDVDEKIAEIQAGGSGTEIDLSQFGSNGRLLMFFTNSDIDYNIVEVDINGKELTSAYGQEYNIILDRDTCCQIIVANVENITEPFTLTYIGSIDGERGKPRVFENIPVPPEGTLVCYKES